MTFLLLVDPIENSTRIRINSIYCGTFDRDFLFLSFMLYVKNILRRISTAPMSPTLLRCIFFVELLLLLEKGFQKIQSRLPRGILKKIHVSVMGVWLIIVQIILVKLFCRTSANSCFRKLDSVTLASLYHITKWDKVFKSGPSKICGRHL